MTDAAGASRSSQQHAPPTSPARPLTRSSAMSARLAGQAIAKQPQQQEQPRSGPESSTTANTNTTTTTTTTATAPASSAPPSSSSSSLAASSTAPTPAPAHVTPSSPPHTPRGPLTRKRAASIITDDTGHSRLERLSLTTPATASPRPFNTPTELICLCTPAPKVPRPRNAFILYRQHHQGQVVAENPGLANPEISKIIGEQWRDEPEENKNQWKRLAEEEKQRHRHQFPDYRYQPRRGNKAGGVGGGVGGVGGAASARTLSTTGPGEDPGRCPNCGGRYIATPTSRTPHTPFGTPTTARPPMPPPYGNPNPRAVEAGPSSSSPQQQPMSRHPDDTNRNRAPQWYPLYDIHEEYGAMSPADSKRRRYNMPASPYPHAANNNNNNNNNNSSNYPPLPSPPAPYGTDPRHMHPSTPIYGPPAPGPLPGPSSLTRSNAGLGPMGPPPPPPRPPLYHHHHHQQQQPPPPPPPSQQPRTTDFDESLRLPPLQTHLPTSPDSDTSAAGQGGLPMSMSYTAHRDAQAQSLEAMVMSIPYVNKIHVLQRISPPLPLPPTAAGGGRGARPVIAVEGADGRLRALVARVVERAVEALGDCEVRRWVGNLDAEEGVEREREGGDVSMAGSRAGSVGSAAQVGAGGDLFGVYLRAMMEWHARSAEMVKFVTTPIAESGRPRLPVALLPGGYSLTEADRFACTVPIGDAYAPVDHWQWMATLWRGVVRPDLVVYVRAVSEEEMGRGVQGVEVKTASLMVVRLPVAVVVGGGGGGGGGIGGSGEVERVERRLEFEVMEWVRGGGFVKGGGGWE
ncbi:hypothetical protein B0T22DRAFT_431616 [Podospora appendiculata]|uniref:HMG box domain-containing protein n=1 Tax=Podospora appendiculata TaxID=314037 RepID=A0AAE0X3N2_9PEZI|nr:hypothetical protein B0T22DRAFT_431616 [Podospora appendiculata]